MFCKFKRLVCIAIILSVLSLNVAEARVTQAACSRSPYDLSEEDIYAMYGIQLYDFIGSFTPYNKRNTNTIAVATVQRLTYEYDEEEELMPITCGAVGDKNYRPIKFYGLWSEDTVGSPYRDNLYHIDIIANAVAKTASYELRIIRKDQGRIPDKMIITVKFDNKTYMKRTFKFKFTNAQKRALKRNKTKLVLTCHEGEDVVKETFKREKGCKTVGFNLGHRMSIEAVYP